MSRLGDWGFGWYPPSISQVIEQAIRDMETEVIKIRHAYSEVLATQKRTEVLTAPFIVPHVRYAVQWPRR